MKQRLSLFILSAFLVAVFSFYSSSLFAETGIARPKGGVVIPKPTPPSIPKVPVVDPLKPVVPKVTPPGGSIPKVGEPASIGAVDPRPAKRLGTHAGEPAPSAPGQRELAPKKLNHEQVMERIKSDALLKQVKDSPEALDGLAVREGLLDSALNGQKDLSHVSAAKFEKSLMEKLVGKDFSKMKEEDLKDLQSLTCGPMCGGHERMALSCRRVTRFIDAMKSTPGIFATSGAIGTLFAAFVNYTDKPEKKNGSEVISVAGDGLFAEVKDLNKEVTQEKLVPAPEKTDKDS